MAVTFAHLLRREYRRAGSEETTSGLKWGCGIRRTRYHGYDRVATGIGLGIFAHNAHRYTRRGGRLANRPVLRSMSHPHYPSDGLVSPFYACVFRIQLTSRPGLSCGPSGSRWKWRAKWRGQQMWSRRNREGGDIIRQYVVSPLLSGVLWDRVETDRLSGDPTNYPTERLVVSVMGWDGSRIGRC